MQPDVSVVIPHYNDPDGLAACVASVVAQEYAGAVEIIVADNKSDCAPERIAAAIGPHATLVVCEERGAGPARNAGAARATHETLVFIDSDCVADAGWLAAGIRALAEADLVGGRMTVFPRDAAAVTGPEAFEQEFAFKNRDYVEKKGFTVTANLFTTKRVFAHVGPFRTQVSEDMDWCHRATALGYRLVYAAEATVAHPSRHSWADLIKKWRRIEAEGYALVKERPGGRWRWLARSWAQPASIPPHLARILASRALTTPAQKMAAAGTLVRLRLWRFVNAHALVWRDR